MSNLEPQLENGSSRSPEQYLMDLLLYDLSDLSGAEIRIVEEATK